MTVKKLTTIEGGRLVPTDLSMDADLIEISKVEGNALKVKEDGLYYKESTKPHPRASYGSVIRCY